VCSSDLPVNLESPPMAARVQTLKESIEAAKARLSGLDTPALVSALRQAFDQSDDVSLNVAKEQLIERGKRGDATVVQAMAAAIGGMPEHLQPYLIEIMGEIPRPEALNALFGLLRGPLGQSETLRTAALGSIAAFGQTLDEQAPLPDLSGILEHYLESHAERLDTAQINAVAQALAGLGTASGVEKLLGLWEKQSSGEARSNIEQNLLETRNTAALPPLQQRLQQDPQLSHPATRIAGNVLAAMGDPAATQVLLDWAANADTAKDVQQALDWLAQTQDADSLQRIRQALKQQSFRSPKLQTELQKQTRELERQLSPEKLSR
jgi:HEAT repeat protein